jgi:hypothetical protein
MIAVIITLEYLVTLSRLRVASGRSSTFVYLLAVAHGVHLARLLLRVDCLRYSVAFLNAVTRPGHAGQGRRGGYLVEFHSMISDRGAEGRPSLKPAG